MPDNKKLLTNYSVKLLYVLVKSTGFFAKISNPGLPENFVEVSMSMLSGFSYSSLPS